VQDLKNGGRMPPFSHVENANMAYLAEYRTCRVQNEFQFNFTMCDGLNDRHGVTNTS